MSNLVTIKPIEKKRWHNIQGEKYLKRPIVIEVLKDEKGRYNTGLTEKEEKELQPNFAYNLSHVFSLTDEESFWNTDYARIVLNFRTHIFDLDIPLDYIHYKMCVASPFVANSMREYNEGLFPYAEFAIEDSAEEEAIIAKRNKVKEKVFVAINKMDKATKIQLVQILGNRPMKGASEDKIDNELHRLLEEKGYKRAYDIINGDKKRNAMMAIIMEAENKNVLRKKGDVYYYMDESLGTIEQAIDYFEDPKNNSVKLQVVEKLNS